MFLKYGFHFWTPMEKLVKQQELKTCRAKIKQNQRCRPYAFNSSVPAGSSLRYPLSNTVMNQTRSIAHLFAALCFASLRFARRCSSWRSVSRRCSSSRRPVSIRRIVARRSSSCVVSRRSPSRRWLASISTTSLEFDAIFSPGFFDYIVTVQCPSWSRSK